MNISRFQAGNDFLDRGFRFGTQSIQNSDCQFTQLFIREGASRPFSGRFTQACECFDKVVGDDWIGVIQQVD